MTHGRYFCWLLATRKMVLIDLSPERKDDRTWRQNSTFIDVLVDDSGSWHRIARGNVRTFELDSFIADCLTIAESY